MIRPACVFFSYAGEFFTSCFIRKLAVLRELRTRAGFSFEAGFVKGRFCIMGVNSQPLYIVKLK